MKINAKSKDCRLLVKIKTSSNETIDLKELDRFSRVFLRCFLKPNLTKENTVLYSGPMGISLQDYMSRPITKHDFLSILEHIVIAVQKLKSHDMPLHNLQMDMRYIYVNEATKELQFLYIPLIGTGTKFGLMDLFNAIIYSAHPTPENDTAYVTRFNYLFRSLRPFDINQVEQFVLREDRSIVNIIKKHNIGQSGFMTSNQQHYYAHLDQKQMAEATALLDEDAPTGLLAEDVPIGLLAEDAPTGLLDDDTQTGLLEENLPTDLSVKEYVVVPQTNEYVTVPTTNPSPITEDTSTDMLTEDASTGLLTIADEDSEATGILYDEEDENTSLLVLEENEDEGGTTLLNESFQPRQYVASPELYRILTGETVKVNKPVFRIGKERSYVDYFVSNNSAVSRSHADIITRSTGFFVVDLNSKNGTFINNVPLIVQQETRICNGDMLRLGNEEFTFRITPTGKATTFCPRCGREHKAPANFCASCGKKL